MQVLKVEVNAAVFLDISQRVTDNREVAQAQKVHLQQANGLTCWVVPAGDISTIGRALRHWNVVNQPDRGHNHRTGVHAGLADNTFETTRGGINLFNIRVGFDHLTNFDGLREALILRVSNTSQRNIFRHNRRRQRAVDAVSHLESRLAKVHLRSILNGLLGFHGTEGNNLRNFVFAPSLSGVLDHLTTAAVIEVDIDIGCRGSLWVQKSLKQQVVFNRVDIGNGQGISHQSTRCRTTARADPNTDGAGMLNNLS